MFKHYFSFDIFFILAILSMPQVFEQSLFLFAKWREAPPSLSNIDFLVQLKEPVQDPEILFFLHTTL